MTDFPNVDFEFIEEEDTLFDENVRESKLQLAERIYKLMEWLSKRAEQVVAISTHSGWLLTIFNGVLECDDKLKGWFQTGEMRCVKVAFFNKEPEKKEKETTKE
eukprot:CAMPEP_0116854094 /NCGR_PEP_ID=MMETSP0418-20121206/18369_1 /TAXON_ID=1158023 /ORGANISM="Astrosyne radiata, Strain 13vi08-1A" /LENGTH=103 /DNA_ID=CAMNT_0004486753 /DNA_START=150 /DNA_END=461 /DNA_ORIENTATION=-